MSARSPSTVPAMSGSTGRPSDYSPTEDEIILRFTSTREVQDRLRRAGFPERTPAAITSRRQLLRSQGADKERLNELHLPPEEKVRMLASRRRKLSEALDAAQREAARITAEIQEVNEELRQAVDELS